MPVSQAPSITPQPAVTSFDGTYRNAIHLVSSFGASKDYTSWCTSPGQPVITIAGGQFSYTVPHPNVPDEPAPVFPATIAEDGSFYGQLVVGSITGRVDSDRIEGRIDGSACLYSFSGSRV